VKQAGFRRPLGRRRWGRGRAVRYVAVAAVVSSSLVLLPATGAQALGAGQEPGGQLELEAELLAAVQDAHFEEALDFGPVEGLCPGAQVCPSSPGPTRQVPNVDVAVIELDDRGDVRGATDVLVSRDHPSGVVAPVDVAGGPAGSYGVSGVRWRGWDIERFDGGTFDPTTGAQLTAKGWNDQPARTDVDDIVAGREGAPLEFMAPYPASLFKLVVAFRIMRLVDEGVVRLDQAMSWDPTPSSGPAFVEPAMELHAGALPTPGGHPAPAAASSAQPLTAAAPLDDTRTQPLQAWLDAMMTHSDNDSARSLLKLLWDLGDLPAMHAELRDLGLGSLQINGTDPATGARWLPGQIHMTAMDTARLLWLIDGGSGTLWTRPDGTSVPSSILSDSSRAFLVRLLEEQAFHEVLSTMALCGAAGVHTGIPAAMTSRWVGPDGVVAAGGYSYGRDVRPCDDQAEVTFGHKTGLTYNYGSDAGIVRSLPGKPGRHYVLAFLSSLGYRYTDPAFASRSTLPCYDAVGAVCYTQRIPAFGEQIDRYLSAPRP
jgi:Beta-lactamase enzyme family